MTILSYKVLPEVTSCSHACQKGMLYFERLKSWQLHLNILKQFIYFIQNNSSRKNKHWNDYQQKQSFKGFLSPWLLQKHDDKWLWFNMVHILKDILQKS